MKKILRYLIYIKNNFTTIAKYKNSHSKIFVDGYPHTKNFGDALSTPIVEFLSEKKVLPSKNISRFLFQFFHFKNYAVIGSILQWIKKDAIVWGAGFISDKNEKIYKPSAVYSVRGPKSRNVYLRHNIECPEIYGDPALLLPLMYFPKKGKKYKFGIIPHYSDFKDPWFEIVKKRSDVKIIDLMVYTNYKKIVDQVLECENILSSSLHGIIVADAYGIPNRQMTLSDKVVGADFKFADYFLSVNREVKFALNPRNCNLEDIDFCCEVSIDLSPLINSCPFSSEDKKRKLLKALNSNSKLKYLNGTKN